MLGILQIITLAWLSFCSTRLSSSMSPLQAELTRYIPVIIAVEVLVLVVHSPVRASIHRRVGWDKYKGVASRVPAVAKHSQKSNWEYLQ